mgnify:FL=1|tara:strand:+ start:178 stop:690 length:513 start_codon:yes stop_codon:yes gene_type:complete
MKNKMKNIKNQRKIVDEINKIFEADDEGAEHSGFDVGFNAINTDSQRTIEHSAKWFKLHSDKCKVDKGEKDINIWLWIGQEGRETWAEVKRQFGLDTRVVGKLKKLGIIVSSFIDDGTWHMGINSKAVHDFIMKGLVSDQELTQIKSELNSELIQIQSRAEEIETLLDVV